MKFAIATPLLVTLMLAAHVVDAATPKAPKPPKPMSVDGSANFLIDPATAEKIWEEATPQRVLRLYPKKRYRYVSEVSGGFNDGKTCVVTARAMLLPVQRNAVVYAPIKSATTFDAVPSLSREQCQAMARGKLKEAVEAIASSIVAS